ncbi:folliculin-interacting protein 1 isoform X1 [Drosophila rhopaloa]|uniref:Folliculin-interacting protein 1 isoform X1 n=1 Tax=Drosophila rhopaloa TaxID=1041015 RepID=A0A6P4F4F9_DRORH|nr:folliculin-interacting protein 1 isoform X1 [Drosophila rhopaloa]
MALLNKLFFPSATPTSPANLAVAPTLTAASAAAALINSQTTATTGTATTTLPARTTHASAGVAASVSATAGNSSSSAKATKQTSRNYLSRFPFEGSQVRVLLYKEDDSRRLLFDSNALQKVTHRDSSVTSTSISSSSSSTSGAGKFLKNEKYTSLQNGKIQAKAHSTNGSNFIEVCAEFGYKHNRPSGPDISPLGEMVFGSLPMSFCGTALKVHWLPEPARILCSQVYLTPTNNGGSGSGHSPYSTLSTNSLATPRSSICSEHGSMDGLSMNSFSMPFSVSVGRQMSLTPPVDVPVAAPADQQSLSTHSIDSNGPRYSSTYSTATDSGYSASGSGSGAGGDQWSYQYSSTRSSLGSVLSDQSDAMRKLSMDSACYTGSSPYLDGFASDGCLQRRISRNLRTSFENEHSKNDFIGFLSDNYAFNGPVVASGGGGGGGGGGGSEGGGMAPPQYRRASYCANESRSNPEMGRRQANLRRRAKLGLAVCISMSESFEEEMELFCSEHIALLESMLSRLRASTEHAYINHKNFLQIMFQAWQDTQQWFSDLFTAPRIKTPVWLSITTSGSKYSKTVAERFIKELCDLLSFADTKDSNFFISTMLTGILTHHLGWVATVSAFNSAGSRRSESSASAAAIEQRAKLLQVAQKHPYNALWAQLGDLYGAIGMPPKLARTIVCGAEKLWVEKLLNVLTYFIRCSEVRRAAKREDFNKQLINDLVAQSQTQNQTSNQERHKSPPTQMRGLSRTATCKQNLNAIADDGDDENGELNGYCEENEDEEQDEIDSGSMDASDGMQTLKKNEIPTVLAFRDSHFVQQELRIGNYLMDTGIDKKTLLARQAQQYFRTGKDGRIRLTVTTPDNVELCVEDEQSSGTGSVSTGSVDDGAIEAIEYEDNMEAPPKKNFFWNMVPVAGVKEGLSLSDLAKLQQGIRIINRKLERRSSSYSVEGIPDQQQSKTGGGIGAGDFEPLSHERRASHLSLSDLITQNSMGKSDRMTWGIEPIKENVSLEEQIHFDHCHKLIEREHGICRQTSADNGNGVVFVLGDNEPLINLKKSNEDLSGDNDAKPALMLCAQHQRTHDRSKHSGMKFNFEQYPQIATNYMKSKNLLMSNYDLLMDKATKLEASEAAALKGSDSTATLAASSSSTAALPPPATPVAANSERCVVCSSGVGLNASATWNQTPSNATELEFETDEMHCYNQSGNGNGSSSKALQSVNSAASIDTLKSAVSIEPLNTTIPTQMPTTYMRKQQPKRVPSGRSSVSSVAAKCAAVNVTQQLLKLPVPGVKELPQDDDSPGEQLRAGFIPSLLLSVSDHYVSDMVLQGTCAPPNKWEMHLREDLALAARSASLISQPAENIAIVADMDKWDVRLISSQTQQFPYAGGQSSPVGMSQLVSSMLETVQAMHVGGIPAYECLSFLESKLQEIYLQSETLAAFLLETDPCRLSDITNPLQLSENDVPLLLSIAYIHTPKISRKCGISFR